MSVLSLTGVCLSFPRGRRHVIRVLADVTLQLDAGEIVAVLAQRAQGKTSLLRVSRLLGGQIGWVGPAVPDLDMPMLANVALPLLAAYGKREAYRRATGALERVGARECAQQFWESLADWERALVAIAQGIAREPKLLLVDDLTLSLGLGETEQITRLLDTLASEQGFAVLMSVSDAGATGWSGRVATLAGGELLESPRSPMDQGNIIDFPGVKAPARDPRHGISS
jgi:ABC-type methionine transport system ATPase subunit